jgi:hypothetical protein
MYMQHVREKYVVRDVQQISDFLDQYPFLESVLETAYHAIMEYFGEVELHLNLISNENFVESFYETTHEKYLLISLVVDAFDMNGMLPQFEAFRQQHCINLLYGESSKLALDIASPVESKSPGSSGRRRHFFYVNVFTRAITHGPVTN